MMGTKIGRPASHLTEQEKIAKKIEKDFRSLKTRVIALLDDWIAFVTEHVADNTFRDAKLIALNSLKDSITKAQTKSDLVTTSKMNKVIIAVLLKGSVIEA